jgi:hypothetical protein
VHTIGVVIIRIARPLGRRRRHGCGCGEKDTSVGVSTSRTTLQFSAHSRTPLHLLRAGRAHERGCVGTGEAQCRHNVLYMHVQPTPSRGGAPSPCVRPHKRGKAVACRRDDFRCAAEERAMHPHTRRRVCLGLPPTRTHTPVRRTQNNARVHGEDTARIAWRG